MNYSKLEQRYKFAHRKQLGKGFDAAFNESDHPRDEDGKFGAGGGGTKQTTTSRTRIVPHEKEIRKSVGKMTAEEAKTALKHLNVSTQGL